VRFFTHGCDPNPTRTFSGSGPGFSLHPRVTHGYPNLNANPISPQFSSRHPGPSPTDQPRPKRLNLIPSQFPGSQPPVPGQPPAAALCLSCLLQYPALPASGGQQGESTCPCALTRGESTCRDRWPAGRGGAHKHKLRATPRLTARTSKGHKAARTSTRLTVARFCFCLLLPSRALVAGGRPSATPPLATSPGARPSATQPLARCFCLTARVYKCICCCAM
jgi:hypothetical protein